MTDRKELCRLALEARKRSYVPYSGYAVGAALLTTDGKIYIGCNIENASYTPTICAERTAIFKAVSEGDLSFAAIAIAGGPKDKEPETYAPPCGVCRQVIREFCGDTFEILLAKSVDEYKVCTLGELFPLSFGPDDLGGEKR